MAAIQDTLTLQQVAVDLKYVFLDKTQVPALDGSIRFDPGSLSKTDIRLTNKQIFASTSEKEDSDIGFDLVLTKANVGTDGTLQIGSPTTVTGRIDMVTSDKHAMITMDGATITKYAQYSDDGVLVMRHDVVPGKNGVVLTITDETLQDPT